MSLLITNSDPKKVDFPIPANDDASKSIALIIDIMVKAVEEGLMERQADKDKRSEELEREEERLIKTRTKDELEEEIEDKDDKPKKAKEVGRRPRIKSDGETESVIDKEKKARKGISVRKK